MESAIPINAEREPRIPMQAVDLIRLLDALDGRGIEAWLDGGWGIDALLAEETREHDDADLVVSVADSARLVETLAGSGYRHVHGDLGSNFVLLDEAGRQVDVHPVRFDGDGDGIYRMETGGDWIYPAQGFTGAGSVLGRPVRCLSPEVQILCHAGYELDEEDRLDLAALEARFGVAVPTA